MQAERQPEYPLLYSQRGYKYCDLLLALTPGPSPSPFFQWPPPGPPARTPGRGELSPAAPPLAPSASPAGDDSPLSRQEGRGLGEGGQGGEGLQAIRQRAEQTLEWVTKGELGLLTIALEHLTLGRIHLALARAAGGAEPDPAHLAQATDHLDQAVDGLRQAGHQWMQPPGLLARAVLRRVIEDPATTTDLDEAFEIADRGGMRLHLTDVHLERARLRVTQGRTDEARQDLEAAGKLVEETGYHRRDPEVAELAAVLG